MAIVLAAMYMLRLVSAVLHREPGEAVPEKAPDLRRSELSIVGALVIGMLALSVWPAGIGKHAFACINEAQAVSTTKNLDRHWRNARVCATHNPWVYKARIVGDYAVNGTPPNRIWAIGAAPIAAK